MGRTYLALAKSSLVAALVMIASQPRPAAGDETPATPSNDAALIRMLFDQMAAHQEEIFSAKIKYRWHIATYRRGENTPERVHALLDEYDLIANPDSLRDLVHTLVPEPATIDPPWELRTFQMLGEKRRADTSQNIIQLIDGTHEMTYQGINEQLTIGERGYSDVHFTDLTDFRSYIPPPRGGLRVEDFRVVANDGHQATLELLPAPGTPEGTIPSRYVFDLATGIMVHSTSYDGDQLGHEVWQLAVTEYPGGIVMPALRVATLYRGGRLNTLRVLIIEEAEFNGPVSEDEFVMPVAEGTVLVDYRHPQTAVWKTETAADDVRSLLVPVSRPAPGVSGGSGLSWQMVLILNGVALIVIATILWRRGSPSQVPPVKPPTSEPS